jgi:hypothetical protein
MRCGAVLALLFLPACTWFSNQDTVLITSEPPGAHIWLNGVDTRATTPATLAIGVIGGADSDLVMRKTGYRPEARHLYQYTEGYTSRWIDGASDIGLFTWPLGWTFGDFFFPFGVRAALVPGQVHVVLHKDDEPLLGFELLRQRAAGQTPTK